MRFAVADEDSEAGRELQSPPVQLSRSVKRRLHDAALEASDVLGVALKVVEQQLRAHLDDGGPPRAMLDGVERGRLWPEAQASA